MVRDILQLGDPLLWQRSAEIAGCGDPHVQHALGDLRDTLHGFQQRRGFGRGISAVQIGELLRLIYIEIDGQSHALLNPRLIKESPEKLLVWDDCFSFPDLRVRVVRSAWVRVEYLDQEGRKRLVEASGDFSELLQHEIDHLDGILAIDRAIDKHAFATSAEYQRRYQNQRVVPMELTIGRLIH